MDSHGSLLPSLTAHWRNKKWANLQECDWSCDWGVVMYPPPGQSLRAGRWDVFIGLVWHFSLLPNLSLWPGRQKMAASVQTAWLEAGGWTIPPKNGECCPLKKGSYSFHISVNTCNASTSLKSLRGLPWWPSGEESACQCRGHGFDPGSREFPTCQGATRPVCHNYWARTP